MLALSDLPLLDQPNPTDFDVTATRALRAAGLQGDVTLVRADGSPAGKPRPSPALPDTEARQRVFQTGVPQISGVYTDPRTQLPCIAIQMPVVRDGTVRYDAVIALSAGAIAAALSPQTLPDGWSASVIGRDGRLIARSLGSPTVIGQQVQPSFAALVAGRSDGFGRAISREGVPLLVAFTQSARTLWRVSIGVPEADVRGPRIRSIITLAAGGGILILAGAGLAWLMGRRIAGPIHRASGRSRAARPPGAARPRNHARHRRGGGGRARLVSGRAVAVRPRPGARGRAAPRRGRARRGCCSRRRPAKIGAWETECATGHRTWSQQQYPLYGVDPREEPPHGDGWSKLIHPDDRARVMGTVSRSYAEPMSYQHEFRIIQPGGRHPLVALGRDQPVQGRAAAPAARDHAGHDRTARGRAGACARARPGWRRRSLPAPASWPKARRGSAPISTTAATRCWSSGSSADGGFVLETLNKAANA